MRGNREIYDRIGCGLSAADNSGVKTTFNNGQLENNKAEQRGTKSLPRSPSVGIPVIGTMAAPECGEPASQVIASLRLASWVVKDVDVPGWPKRSSFQLALLIVGTLKS